MRRKFFDHFGLVFVVLLKKKRQGKGMSATVAGWSHIASHRYLHSQEMGLFERDMVRYLSIYR